MLTKTSKPTEIAKRTAIFTAVGQVGSMCAGLMMTAMHKTMEGHGGLKGWQWVFIIGKYLISCFDLVCGG
jgi:ACS family pantothenate transporter-like MFS transporter